MHQVVYEATMFPEWLTAIGGIGAFIATARLAFLARRQMTAAQNQVDVMRDTSKAEAAAVEKQITASIAQGEAIREAARAQLQPMVFAHGDCTHTYAEPADEVVMGRQENEYLLSSGQVGFGYKLANEGTGLALNIRHGVDVGGTRFEYGGGMHWRALRPGESQPGQDSLDQGVWIRIVPLVVVCDERELPPNWEVQPRHYWTEFESVFGERFRTRNPNDPRQPAEFERIEGP